MKKTFYLLVFLLFVSKVFAQNTIILPDRVSVPKMTTVIKNSLPNKTEGMMVYDATLQQFSYWTGTTWANFGSTALGTNGWQQTGQNINYSNLISNNNSSTTYTNTTNINIPDNSSTGVSSIINVPLTGDIIDPNLITTSISLNHTFCGDIVATLIAPSGNRFVLLNRIGTGSYGSSNNFISSNVLNFNNLAIGQIATTTLTSDNIAAGTYLPSGGTIFPISNLANLKAENISGNWTLLIQDLGGADTGNLVSWSLSIGANALGSIGKVGINTTSPQAQLDVKGGMNVSQNVGIGVTTPQTKLDVNGDFKVSANQNWEVKVTQNNMANIELRQLSGGGTPFIDFSDDATADYDGRLILSGNAMIYSHAASSGAHVFNNGTQTLFSINGNGSAEVNGSFKTKYSGSIIHDPASTGLQTITLTIPAVPAGWDYTNTLVLVSIADGGYGIIEQARLESLTTIRVIENVVDGSVTRYSYIIFKL